MKTFNNYYISERLKLSKDSKISTIYNNELVLKCCHLLHNYLINIIFSYQLRNNQLTNYCNNLIQYPASTIDDLGLDLVELERLTKKEWKDAEDENIFSVIKDFCIKLCEKALNTNNFYNIKFDDIYKEIQKNTD